MLCGSFKKGCGVLRKTLLRLQDLLASLQVLTGIYDSFRVVDPAAKKAYALSDTNDLVESKDYCFEIWGRGSICTNCISSRALNEGETFVKIEGNGKNASMVTSIPMLIHDKTMVLEIIKAMPGGLYISKGPGGDSVELYGMIESMNSAVVTDPLTGIFNRRYIDERLPAEMVSAVVNAAPLSVVMADIDFFKAVNDTFGHTAGDAVLKAFSELLGSHAKKAGGWAARYGGEEFFICLPGAELDAAAQTAEELRHALESKPVAFGEYRISVTSSFGVAQFDGVLAHGIAPLLNAADKNLYTAKTSGRNRVVAAKNDAFLVKLD